MTKKNKAGGYIWQPPVVRARPRFLKKLATAASSNIAVWVCAIGLHTGACAQCYRK